MNTQHLCTAYCLALVLITDCARFRVRGPMGWLLQGLKSAEGASPRVRLVVPCCKLSGYSRHQELRKDGFFSIPDDSGQGGQGGQGACTGRSGQGSAMAPDIRH